MTVQYEEIFVIGLPFRLTQRQSLVGSTHFEDVFAKEAIEQRHVITLR
jgi:hypothetical protein